MENLKEKRLGYGYCNAKGEQMLVTEYRNNKRVVVKNVTTGAIHQCRWCDLQNVRCPAVYDATAARNRFKEELDAARTRFEEELDKVSAITEKPAGGASDITLSSIKMAACIKGVTLQWSEPTAKGTTNGRLAFATSEGLTQTARLVTLAPKSKKPQSSILSKI